jgi:glutathione S-transferase
MTMQLYYFPGACSLASHIALEWVGAPYETVKMDLPGTKSPEYLALNPNGAVPLLVVIAEEGSIDSQARRRN